MFNAGKLLANTEIIKGLPKGSSWFSLDSLSTGEVSKLIDAISSSVGDWINAIYDSQQSIYLSTAADTDLDLWGADVSVFRKPSEGDTTYRARIGAEILAKKLTKPAIEEFIYTELGIPTTVYLPWQDLAIYDYGYDDYETNGLNYTAGRSGTKRRSSNYYTAGVIDVKTEGWDPAIWDIVARIKGAPIKAYFTPRLTPNGQVVTPDTDDPESQYKIFWFTEVPLWTPKQTEFGEILSGAPDLKDQSLTITRYTLNDTNLDQKLWDSPKQPNGDFRSTSMTWDTVGDLTWDQLLAGHNRQVSASINITTI